MGGMISTLGSEEPSTVTTHRELNVDEFQFRIATPLSDINARIFNELNGCPFFKDVDMIGFLEKICIAKITPMDGLYIAELNLNPRILEKNLEVVKQILFDIASLSVSGQNLLKELNHLLGDDHKLVISFSNPPKTSLKMEVLRFAIEPNTRNLPTWVSPTIKLPEKCEDFRTLDFYCPSKKTVFNIQEPIFLIVVHELVHCTQYLQGECDEWETKGKTSDEIRTQFPNCALLDVPEFQHFWGGKGNWALEFQAMVTGVTCSDSLRVSESLAIQEFLNSDLLNEARFESLQQYRGQILIPFGHDENQKVTEEYLGFMRRCCEMLPHLDTVATSVPPTMSLGTMMMFDRPTMQHQTFQPDYEFGDTEITTIAGKATELERSEDNLQAIRRKLAAAGYHIQDVLGDGNCGFYAILQALDPARNYEHVDPGDDNWHAAERLRQHMFPNDPDLSQMVTRTTSDVDRQRRYLPLDNQNARQAIFAIAGRQVIVINSTYNSNNPSGDPLNNEFMILNEDGSITLCESFQAALGASEENPIVLLYTPGHWQAAMPINLHNNKV